MGDHLSALDATFLELEEHDEGALMNIGGVMVFDPLPDGQVPTLEELCSGSASRLEQLPRYTQRLSSPRTGGLAWPRWVPDGHFDIRNHVGRAALPAPGGPSELCDWTADFYSHRLDRTRPLWQLVLLEGLDFGRWALALKTHHCLVDGVGAVDVVRLLLDSEATPAGDPFESPAALYPGDFLREAAPTPHAVVQATRAGVRSARAGAHAVRHPREALERSLSMAELFVRDELIAAPETSLNVPIGSTRRYAVVHVPLGQLKSIRAVLGGSVNDVALAACAAGLRKLLLERGETPPHQGLRAMVPTNLRDRTERLGLGNRVSSLFVDLPVAEPSAEVRYRKISTSTARLKRSGAAAAASGLIELAALAPPLLRAELGRSLYAKRLFNVTLTNVPGPRDPLYALGAQLREIHPVVPLAAEHTVGVAIFSYHGLVTFGVIADADTTPDIGVLAAGIEEGIEELSRHVPASQGAKRLEPTRS
ncbi:MAG TPA: wax ester/triacylglycerol synthase family O-acyltransferase [Solirubrobacteraceae bacterium]|nr:wax ester/triacylglycerol synthase family O-acyltransferase [Solirubrobacteraceae bacterium]